MELEQGILTNYPGSYSYYKEKKEELRRLQEEKSIQEVKRTVKVEEKPKINKSKLRDEIAAVEREIAQMEEYKETLSQLLANPSTYQDEEYSKEKVAEFKRLEEELPQMYEKWEELCLILEDP